MDKKWGCISHLQAPVYLCVPAHPSLRFPTVFKVKVRICEPRSSGVQQRAAVAAAAAVWGLVWASRGLQNAAGPGVRSMHGTLLEWCRQRRRGAKHRAEAWEAWI
uniref:Uncharacterized protein n=1 Tax=Dunaliella tertiolecta TaxID=3047 RepID=A0A7S3VUI1_DUNTE